MAFFTTVLSRWKFSKGLQPLEKTGKGVELSEKGVEPYGCKVKTFRHPVGN